MASKILKIKIQNHTCIPNTHTYFHDSCESSNFILIFQHLTWLAHIKKWTFLA